MRLAHDAHAALGHEVDLARIFQAKALVLAELDAHGGKLGDERREILPLQGRFNPHDALRAYPTQVFVE